MIAVGTWSLVMLLYRLFLMPSQRDFAPLVLPVGAEADAVEGRLRWAYWQTRSGGKYGFLYILDCGMNEETDQICRQFAREWGNVEIGGWETLQQRLCPKEDLQP
ncbi:MAG: hypothetical protein PHE47_05645 [Oscillospiraceae bacterium]|nr:hypothetical protein [Oscillospiraceae bacterium]